MQRLRAIAIALATALAGAAAFVALGVPAGALVGSTVAVAAISLAGLKPDVPTVLRNVAFATIGASLGAGVSPHILSDLARFPVSLAGLTVTLALVMVLSNAILMRRFGFRRTDALLATSPGAMSYSLSLATSRPDLDVDVAAVMTLQSFRLLLITIALPPIVAAIDGYGASAHAALDAHFLGVLPSAVLIALSAVVGAGFERLGVPAAYLLAGVAVSGLGHGFEVVEGRPATAIAFAGFALAGAVIGYRFARVNRTMLRRLLGAGLLITTTAVVISGIGSAVIAAVLGLPFGQVWVSFAPGGVEGMSAMALTLGYDPVYVATHHIFRLLCLLVALPLLIRGRG